MTDTQSLADRQAITDLVYRYCRSVDRIDPELGHSIFHADATADYGDFYKGDGRGAIDAICASHRHMANHSHQVTNIIYRQNEDLAATESYFMAGVRMLNGEQLMQVNIWGRYLDSWSRRDGKWGIDKRTVVYDLDEVRPITPAGQTGTGSRDKSDPSYSLFDLKG